MKKFGLINALVMTVALSACVTPMTSEKIALTTKGSATIDVSDIDHTSVESVEVLRKRVAVAASLVCSATWRSDRFSAYHKPTCRDSINKDFKKQRSEVSATNTFTKVRAVKASDSRRK